MRKTMAPSSNDESTSPKAKGKRLERLRNLTGLSRQQVANKYGIKHGTLKGWEVGTASGLSRSGADTIIKSFSSLGVLCNHEWLMYGIGSGPRIIELISQTSENITENKNLKTIMLQVQEEKQIIKELEFFRKNNPHSIDLIIKDNAMKPFYSINDYVAGMKRYNDEIQSIIEKDCIVQTRDGRILLRKLKQGKNNHCFNLICTNLRCDSVEPILYDVELVSAAQVIWIRRCN